MRLIANGIKNGKKFKVEYDGSKWLFNGKTDYKYEAEVAIELEKRHFCGGTFQPEKDSDLNLINVIENYFFDRSVFADVKGADVDEMESAPGRIY